MDKLRLTNMFSESYPIINFILYENEDYFTGDSEILAFICEKLSKELSNTVFKSLSKLKSGGEDRSTFKKRRTAAIWNYSIAVNCNMHCLKVGRHTGV
jgi:hypothetical protein